MNPCPCGYRSDPRRACSCTPPFTQLAEMPPGPTSAEIRAQVLEARSPQSKRFGPKGVQVNGRMTPRQVRKFCVLKPEAAASSRRRWRTWACRPARTTRCYAWRGRSPTSRATTTSARSTSPRPSGIARSTEASISRYPSRSTTSSPVSTAVARRSRTHHPDPQQAGFERLSDPAAERESGAEGLPAACRPGKAAGSREPDSIPARRDGPEARPPGHTRRRGLSRDDNLSLDGKPGCHEVPRTDRSWRTRAPGHDRARPARRRIQRSATRRNTRRAPFGHAVCTGTAPKQSADSSTRRARHPP